MTATMVTVPTAPRPSASTISGAVVTIGIERSAIETGSATRQNRQHVNTAASAAPSPSPAR